MRVFTQGAISERLAEYIVGTMAFTTEVPYREDVGHDFHCVLYVPSNDGTMLNAGPSFSIQVKSNRRPIRFTKLHAREWLATQQSPFFVCVVDRDGLTCEFFSTWNIHNGVLHYGYGALDDPGSVVNEIRLTMTPPGGEWAGHSDIVDPGSNGGILEIPLGPPILALSPDSVRKPEEAKKYAHTLKAWIDIEYANIVRIASGMYSTLGPDTWKTNLPLEEFGTARAGLFTNPKNLYNDPSKPFRPSVIENYKQYASALVDTIRAYRRLGGDVDLPNIRAALDAVNASLLSVMEDRSV